MSRQNGTHPLVRAATAYDTLTRTTDQVAALLAGCTPCELAQRVAQDPGMATATYEPDDTSTDYASDGLGMVPWEGTLTIEARMTGDGRWIDSGALRWENLPLPLRWVEEDSMGHMGAVNVGTIDSVERRPGGIIWGTGFIDTTTDEGAQAARMVGNRQKRGVSVDMDDVSFEVRVAADLLAEEAQMWEDGPAAAEDNPTDAEGRVVVVAVESGDEVFATTGGRIRAATIVDIPAFIDAEITLRDTAPADMPLTLVAASTPVDPPAAWFANPNLTGPTRLTITDDGRVYGHVAIWGTCHRTHTQAGRCITPPYSSRGYADFMTGTLRTREGDTIPVGRITMDTTHASTITALSAAAAAMHYEVTGSGVVDCAAGEDAHGIWVAGALRPGVSAAKVRELRASPLSGDWRDVGGGTTELVAILAVNTAGFPIPQAAGLVASGGVLKALVAAGTLPLDTPRGGLTDEDMDLLRELAQIERDRRVTAASGGGSGDTAPVIPAKVAAMAARIQADSLARRVQAVGA